MISDRFKILLDELGISQRQFALKMNIDPGYISKIVNGKAEPSDKILLLVEKIFGVNKEWLESGEGEIFSSTEISAVKKELFQLIDKLSDDEAEAVIAFIRYLKEDKKD